MTRICSLVPSVTQTLAAMGAARALVGVTDYCQDGVPAGAARIGGTKNPRVAEILDLCPDVVVANAEENRPVDLDALRAGGADVRVTFPTTVADVEVLLLQLGELAGVDAAPFVAELRSAIADADQRRPVTPIPTLTLIWRKPWMGVGPDTYADDLLRRCGFANVLTGFDARYPRLDPALVLAPQLVLLPSEPYDFTDADLPAVRELVGSADIRFTDGKLLTWHGTLTASALRAFSILASQLS